MNFSPPSPTRSGLHLRNWMHGYHHRGDSRGRRRFVSRCGMRQWWLDSCRCPANPYRQRFVEIVSVIEGEELHAMYQISAGCAAASYRPSALSSMARSIHWSYKRTSATLWERSTSTIFDRCLPMFAFILNLTISDLTTYFRFT